MKRLFIVAAMMLATAGMQAQSSKYIVKTKGAKQTSQQAEQSDSVREEKPQDFLSRYFRYVSMCDWDEGMRFMVVPDKKDLVVKTFADAATGQMVSSTALRHKIMIYKGHENTGGLHERVNFVCEDDGKAYYFEVPTATFDDYCFGKFGVPTLAYLGDVDTAIEVLKDKTMFTVASEYYVDTELDGDGYDVIYDVKEGTEVKVVAIGVGTRSFPVKIIVADESGREFYQNVAISHTNCGMRDDEFDISNMRFHTFKGAFELPADNMAVGSVYRKYIGQEVYTLYSTNMADASGKVTKVARLSTFKIRDIHVQHGTHYVKMTLQGLGTGKIYTKEVSFSNQDAAGDTDGSRGDIFTKLFVQGNPLKMEGVQKSHLADIQKGVVRHGFTENEVKLALGEPSRQGDEGASYTWVYNNPGQPYTRVYFDKKIKRVTSIKK